MMHGYIVLVVVVGGASVLALEILGTRLIGPFYGVSLYLWSALIGVTLAALACGYALGGRWADRQPRLTRLAGLLGVAGAWVVLIPWLRGPVLGVTEAAGLRVAVLVTATVLFFPPLALLGAVSPYALRLRASRLEEVGRTAGNLYALSTAASVVAAIGTGFFLIPSLGVTRLTWLIGALLMLTSLAGFVVARRRPRDLVASAAVAIAALVLLATGAAGGAAPARGVLAVAHSAYGEVRVVERDGLRFMIIDGGTHTIVDPHTWASAFPYVDVIDVAKGYFARPGRLLLVGLGGGSVAKSFARDGWQVDAVEIDPVVTAVAREHFGLTDAEARVCHADGRRFLAGAGTYDLVILDAFGSGAIPFHLVTAEAFALVRAHLAPGGVVALNVEAQGWHDILVRSLVATLGRSFAEVLVLPIAEPPDALGNLVLLASDRSLDLPAEPPVPTERASREYNQAHAWDNRFRPPTEGAVVLTDDLNPVDIWSDRINRAARGKLHAQFAPGVAW